MKGWSFEYLPSELVGYIFSLLTFDEKIFLRMVDRKTAIICANHQVMTSTTSPLKLCIPCDDNYLLFMSNMTPIRFEISLLRAASILSIVPCRSMYYGEEDESSDEDDEEDIPVKPKSKKRGRPAKSPPKANSYELIKVNDKWLPPTTGDGNFDLRPILEVLATAKKLRPHMVVNDRSDTDTSECVVESNAITSVPLTHLSLIRCDRVIDLKPLCSMNLQVEELEIDNCCLVYNADDLVIKEKQREQGDSNSNQIPWKRLIMKNVILSGHLHPRPFIAADGSIQTNEEIRDEYHDEQTFPLCHCEWHSCYPITRFQQYCIGRVRQQLNLLSNQEEQSRSSNSPNTNGNSNILLPLPGQGKGIPGFARKSDDEVHQKVLDNIKKFPSNLVQKILIMTLMRLTYLKQVRPCDRYCYDAADSSHSICGYLTNVHYKQFTCVDFQQVSELEYEQDTDQRPEKVHDKKKRSNKPFGKRRKKRKTLPSKRFKGVSGESSDDIKVYRVCLSASGETVFDSHDIRTEAYGDGEMVLYFKHIQANSGETKEGGNEENSIGQDTWQWKSSGIMTITCQRYRYDCKKKLAKYYDHFICEECEDHRCA